MTEKKILAIVVTFNRLQCLKECLASLNAQTYKNFDILVVNNGSTDGTKEFLDSQNEIQKIHQENLGGAGGFYSGMKYAYEKGYEWLWMMDDDGITDENQLMNLYTYRNKSIYLNALVLDRENHDKLAFSHCYLDISKIKSVSVDDKFVQPFNGTFFHRTLIEKIGFIKKEMFIWGDEAEYTLRAKKAGVIPMTITTALHYHPKEKAQRIGVIPFVSLEKLTILEKPRSLSQYFYRNLGYINKTYGGFFKSSFTIIKYSIYFLRTLQFSEMKKFLTFYRKGILNEF